MGGHAERLSAHFNCPLENSKLFVQGWFSWSRQPEGNAFMWFWLAWVIQHSRNLDPRSVQNYMQGLRCHMYTQGRKRCWQLCKSFIFRPAIIITRVATSWISTSAWRRIWDGNRSSANAEETWVQSMIELMILCLVTIVLLLEVLSEVCFELWWFWTRVYTIGSRSAIAIRKWKVQEATFIWKKLGESWSSWWRLSWNTDSRSALILSTRSQDQSSRKYPEQSS